MDFFDYQKPTDYGWRWQKGLASGRKGLLLFTSAIPSPFPENNLVRVRVLQRFGTGPATILLHGLYETLSGKLGYISRWLYQHGFTVLLLPLPYHMDRTPKGRFSGQLFLTTSVEHTVTAFRQAVIDLRSLVDIIEAEPEFASSLGGCRIGALGISMGAVILNTAFAVEKRLKAAVSVLGGGNLTTLFAKSPMTIPLKLVAFAKGLRPRHYRRVTQDYRSFLKEVQKKGLNGASAAWPWFWLDPLTYATAGYFHNRNLLMINALFDCMVPRENTKEFWRAAGKPEIIWLPCSHFTTRLFISQVLHSAKEFLFSKL